MIIRHPTRARISLQHCARVTASEFSFLHPGRISISALTAPDSFLTRYGAISLPLNSC